jgi:hypothetical protein
MSQQKPYKYTDKRPWLCPYSASLVTLVKTFFNTADIFPQLSFMVVQKFGYPQHCSTLWIIEAVSKKRSRPNKFTEEEYSDRVRANTRRGLELGRAGSRRSVAIVLRGCGLAREGKTNIQAGYHSA